MRSFFSELEAQISTRRSRHVSISTHLSQFAEAISSVPTPYSFIGNIIAKLVRPREVDIHELKRKIAVELRSYNRILVIIDDIDRLAHCEIREVFRLVKAVGDFPNTTYMLLMDRQVAIDALKDPYDSFSDAYLDKIIQYPFRLPTISSPLLEKLFIERLNIIFQDTPAEFDQTYWGNIYIDGIKHFMRTPRDIIRLVNSLVIVYPAIRTEINPTDLIAVEALRIFCPIAYDTLASNREMFAGATPLNYVEPSEQALAEFHSEWIGQVSDSDRHYAKRLLTRLFPKLEIVWGNKSYYGNEHEQTWRKEHRICSPELFHLYFRLSIPSGTISNTEMSMALSLAHDYEAFEKYLEDAISTSRFARFLSKMEDMAETAIDRTSIPNIVRVLFSIGEKSVELYGTKGFEIEDRVRIDRLILRMLQPISRPDRFSILRNAIDSGTSISTMGHFLHRADRILDRTSASEQDPLFLTRDELAELISILIDKIRAKARDCPSDLLLNPQLMYILFDWRRWGNEQEPRDWIRGITKDDGSLIMFLHVSMNEIDSQSINDVVSTRRREIDLATLKHFLDLQETNDRLQRMPLDGLSSTVQDMVGSFIQSYREMTAISDDPAEAKG